jgi:serine/threonine-protein kinase
LPLALSPDGGWLAYVAKGESGTRLVKRRLDSLEIEEIPRTEHSSSPFFSPGGRWLGFGVPLSESTGEPKLRKVPLAGGAPVDLCRVENLVLAHWQEDGSIIFGAIPPAGIYRVSDRGGDPLPITLPDYESGEWYRLGPQLLPGDKGLLLVVGRAEGPALGVLSLNNDELRILVEGVFAGRYVPSGHIVYPQEGKLIALPFDAHTLAVTGEPVDITEPGMGVGERDPFEWAFSLDGTMVYAPITTGLTGGRELVWQGRDGAEQPIGFPAPPLNDGVSLSPDGRRLASGSIDPGTLNWDVRIYDLESGASTRVTFSPAVDATPGWTPDGQRIVFASQRTGSQNLFWKDVHGTGEIERLTHSDYNQFPSSWSPDGTTLFFSERGHPELHSQIGALHLDEDPPTVEYLLDSPFNEYAPAISPDGRWLAYASDETGEMQIWVRPHPAMDRKWPVSIDGGQWPGWSPQGRSIVFHRPGTTKLMEAKIRTEPEFSVGRPRVVLDDPHLLSWHGMSTDGERFLVVKAPPEEKVTELIVVENWFEVLRQKAPPRRN